MAKKRNTYKSNSKKAAPEETKSEKSFSVKDLKFDIPFDASILRDKKARMAFGFVNIALSVFLFFSFFSFLFTGKADQSIIESVGDASAIENGLESRNWLGLFGAYLSYFFVYKGFGLMAFAMVPVFMEIGLRVAYERSMFDLKRGAKLALFSMLWGSVLFGYIVLLSDSYSWLSFLGGDLGYHTAFLLNSLSGWGTLVFLATTMAIFVVYFFKKDSLQSAKDKIKDNIDSIEETVDKFKNDNINEMPFGNSDLDDELIKQEGNTSSAEEKDVLKDDETIGAIPPEPQVEERERMLPEVYESKLPSELKDEPDKGEQSSLPFSISNAESLDEEEEATSLPVPSPNVLPDTIPPADTVSPPTPPSPPQGNDTVEAASMDVEDWDMYDPRLDLSHYKFPSLDILNDIGDHKVEISNEELEDNIAEIMSILESFKINVVRAKTKVTIGPTVTLYEIVPAAGVKISKIRSLEDDIALNLKALGIRIIAPIPGKGTIGIEVPNKKRKMVSIFSILSTKKFQESTHELPIAFGRTISNEVFIADLAKMPHLLMAGATGQGKSVGINVIISSLLYKKHPSEVKFVLVDPKKVELSLFNKIERHFLASVPGIGDAIITDTRKVVGVLSSLCTEMDMRYDLLKMAGCRNLKEYNNKFKHRKLNPNLGHRYLPYIVLVIDELADLMMTAGKEVETPIARLAQLARATGIHLIVATQRPSVNVITGMIKANFPARLSFRVIQKIDSRTILDANGADQLIGQGDMLMSNGSEIIRLQCAFIDTDEAEKLTEFIGEQQGYSTPYQLPEFDEESDEAKLQDLLENLDSMFDDAARLIVNNQSGSTSLIQRKMSLGYNRAGRIMDQLEAAGIVGPSAGSKPREVYVTDLMELEEMIRTLRG